MRWILFLLALAACCWIAAPAAGATIEDATSDHDAVIFRTNERLLPEDRDQRATDLYLRRGAELTLVSTSPTDTHDSGSVQRGWFDPDDSRIIFSTTQRLVEEDRDSSADSYLLEDEELRLYADTVPYRDSALRVVEVGDGRTFMVGTDEALLPTDIDGVQDIYRVQGDDVELISRGSTVPVPLVGETSIADDGRSLVLSTKSQLVDQDGDSDTDLYRIGGDASELISSTLEPRPRFVPLAYGASPETDTVVWTTYEKVVAGDQDRDSDVYIWADGHNSLVSSSPQEIRYGGASDRDALVLQPWVSRDARTVAFATRSRLTAEDDDFFHDVYRWHDGALDLVSPRDRRGVPSTAMPVSISANGSTVIFSTPRQLRDSDEDSRFDLYGWDGSPSHISNSTSGVVETETPRFLTYRPTPDGSAVVFETNESLTADDQYRGEDLYLWRNGSLDLVTTEPGPAENESFDPVSGLRMNPDGGLLFESARTLTAEDLDDDPDIYSYENGRLRLLSGVDPISAGSQPETTVDSGPAPETRDRRPAFRYSSSDPYATFQCRLGSAPWAPCTNSTDGWRPADELQPGPYVFEVRAVGWNGVTDQTPAEHRFRIDTSPPVVSIRNGPTGVTADRSPGFSFDSDDAISVECSIDRGQPDFDPCSGSDFHYPLQPLSDGTYEVRVRGRDQAGNVATASRSFSVDATAPETSMTDGPDGPIADATPDFSFASEAGAEFQCRVDGIGAYRCSSPATTWRLADGPHSFEVWAIDQVGNADPTPARKSFTVDTEAPEVSIIRGPEGTVAEDVAEFEVEAEEGSTTECRVDGNDWIACGARPSFDLVDGRHLFEVRARDRAGNTSVAERSFTVDTSAPRLIEGRTSPTSVDVSTGPKVVTVRLRADDQASGVASAQVTFEGPLAGSRLRAFSEFPTSGTRADGVFELAVTVPVDAAVGGWRLASVRLIDRVGNAVDLAAGATYPSGFDVVDVTAPSLEIESGPGGLTAEPRPVFGFRSEAGASLECSLDSGRPSFGPCSATQAHSPPAPLADGAYEFRVRATDASGNATTRTRGFAVDASVPDTEIVTGPDELTNDSSPRFRFSSTESGARFDCRLTSSDPAPWSACSSAEIFRSVADGAYTFEVRARDEAGNVDPSPAVRGFVVDTVAPSLRIEPSPALTREAMPTFRFSAGEDASAITCVIDGPQGGEPGVCTGTGSHAPGAPLSDADYTFGVTVRDDAGNETNRSRGFRVDTSPPETRILSGPLAPTADPTHEFQFTASEAGSTFECRLDAGQWQSCTSATRYSSLDQGAHSFEVRAQDGAGNIDPSPASREFEIDLIGPSVRLTQQPPAIIRTRRTARASFRFQASERDVDFECRLQNAAYRACASPKIYRGLVAGRYRFGVRGVDALGNSGTPTIAVFRVRRLR